jgi:hypothetical protein
MAKRVSWVRLSVIGEDGCSVLDEKTGILSEYGCSEEARFFLYHLCLRDKTATNIKKTILRKGGGPGA